MKYLSILISLFFLVALSACQKFLDVKPQSDYVLSDMYQTQDQYVQAIAGVYSIQQGLYASNTSWYRAYIAKGTDEYRAAISGIGGSDVFTDNGQSPWANTSWSIYYNMANRCNNILSRIDSVEFADDTLKNNIKGEALMFRAYSYFTLGWIFGGVPLINRPVTDNEAREIGRSTQEETFEFAEADYRQAIELLPESWPARFAGRVTKYAAEGMLARMYMFQSRFADAIPLLADIIESGNYSMAPEYVDCFTDSENNGPERVWEVQFIGNLSGLGSQFNGSVLPQNFSMPDIMPFPGSSSAMPISNIFYDSYEKNDARRNVSILKGYTTLTGLQDTASRLMIKYVHFREYTPQSQNDWAINLPILRYTDVVMMYAEAMNETRFSPNGDVVDILNKVRERANLPKLTKAQTANQNAIRQAIRKERRYEFAFEGLRWLDLVRWDIVVDVLNENFQSEEKGSGKYVMEEHNKISPIPTEEIIQYGDESKLFQNPGY